MPVAVGGDDGVASHSGQHTPGQMARAGIQLFVSDTLDHDLVETDPRYAKPRHRRPKREVTAGERYAVRDALARCGNRAPGLLLFPLLPGKVCAIGAARVPQAGMAHEHRSRDAEADTGEPAHAISHHDGR